MTNKAQVVSRYTNRGVALLWPLMAAVALLFVSGCNLIGESGKSESGIAGDGVTSGDVLPKIGDGSDSAWSDNCVMIVDKTEWRWGWWQDDYDDVDVGSDVTLDEVPKPRDPYIFTIDSPTLTSYEKWGHSQAMITLLEIPYCKIDRSTKIAYTTRNWLCTGDKVKVNGNDCTIEKIED